MKPGQKSSRSSIASRAESEILGSTAEGEPAVSVPVLRRWAERGFMPAAGLAQLPGQRFTGFPPLVEQELPSVAVEVVE